MGTTNFYMGSLRYGPTGKRRKNHAANPVKRKAPREFKPMRIDPIRQAAAMKAAEIREQEKQDFLERISKVKDSMGKKESLQYAGERKLLGIATMHKSNAVPIFESDKEHAVDIARMRR